jgi:hypothetical protein
MDKLGLIKNNKKDEIDKLMEKNNICSSLKNELCRRIINICCPQKQVFTKITR